LEAYFQEAGRAGRDGKKAYAILLYNGNDRRTLLRRVGYNYPPLDTVKDVYDHLAYFFQVGLGSGEGHRFLIDIAEFSHIYHHQPLSVESSLRILQGAGYIFFDEEPDSNTRCRFLLSRNELYLLNATTPEEDSIITAMLRTYSGLFTDYVFISLPLVAHLSGLTTERVYQLMRGLSQRHIISFVPGRSLPDSVYSIRKNQYEQHIKSMLQYATDDSVCRSRQLLRYFGEKQTEDCGMCDVCINKKYDVTAPKYIASAREQIQQLLSDGKKHTITELQQINSPLPKLCAALEDLVNEEDVVTDGTYFWNNS
jgi:ATP-dependent DNA helicase RecQ